MYASRTVARVYGKEEGKGTSSSLPSLRRLGWGRTGHHLPPSRRRTRNSPITMIVLQRLSAVRLRLDSRSQTTKSKCNILLMAVRHVLPITKRGKRRYRERLTNVFSPLALRINFLLVWDTHHSPTSFLSTLYLFLNFFSRKSASSWSRSDLLRSLVVGMCFVSL